MPPAKSPTRSRSRSRRAFREPAALKRLNRSLDTAHEALTDLRKDTGRDVSHGARALYNDLRTFVSSARRDTGKLATALQRDFERAQKQVSRGTNGRGKHPPASRQRASRPAAKRSTSRKS